MNEQQEKLTMNVLFSGIGCQERGITNTNLFNVSVLNTAEINKEAMLSYAAVHCGLTQEVVENYKDYPTREEMAMQLTEKNIGYAPEKDKYYSWEKLIKRKNKDLEKYWLASKMSNNLGDITKINKLPYADMWTSSFPCTDISGAGKMRGFTEESGTRSSLLWETIRLLKEAKETQTMPKYILFENVKNLVSKKYINDFNKLIEVLEELGFNVYWDVINSKNCGVPQNRERVFIVCIRKDIDKGTFVFPKAFDVGIRLKDILESVVQEKYYLNEQITQRFVRQAEGENIIGRVPNGKGTNFSNDMVYHTEKNVGTLKATDYKSPKMIMTSSKNENVEPINTTNDGSARTIKAQYAKTSDANFKEAGIYGATGVIDNCIIRKLTPVECWKLMGMSAEDCAHAHAVGVAASQLYKQAGNGIVTNCVALIAEHIYKAQYNSTYQCTDEKITGVNADSEVVKVGNIYIKVRDRMEQ